MPIGYRILRFTDDIVRPRMALEQTERALSKGP